VSSPPRPQPQAPLRLPPSFWHVTALTAALAAVVMLSTHRNAQLTAAGLVAADAALAAQAEARSAPATAGPPTSPASSPWR
jgi:hypothetical protein